MSIELTPALLLDAYANGIFPMANDDGEILWFSPDPRAIFELDDFHVPRNLQKLYRKGTFGYTINGCFETVIDACAARPEGTWISPEIRTAYVALHETGFAHSVEVWQGEELAGGLYGVSFGGAFFGESMFHRVTNASKLSLVYLVDRLRACGFTLLDTQFTTPHLMQFNCIEIPRAQYLDRLSQSLQLSPRLTPDS